MATSSADWWRVVVPGLLATLAALAILVATTMGEEVPGPPAVGKESGRKDKEMASVQEKRAGKNAKKHKHTNQLAGETSPYLLQHAHNPIDWYPWGEEAFKKARKEDKPVFLSVGYSACHWCHVMERESFEDEEVAKLLNDKFVCVKVDREERPDVDDIYMKYVHLTRRSGGWPMSIVMTPKGAPFFGGTYFPKPLFMKIMAQLSVAWNSSRGEILKHCEEVVKALRALAREEYETPRQALTAESVDHSVSQLANDYFDFRNGGHPGRMKFPPHNTMALLVHLLAGDPERKRAREMVELTLGKMQRGGIHDHLAGGFHRYSVDSHWFLPHFEKMLYDNAQMGAYYARASAVLGREDFARTARALFDWVLKDMTSKDGVFYSAYDADSAGEEGKFYVWDHKEIAGVLGDDAPTFSRIYGIKKEGNFHEEASGHATGLNIPHLSKSLAEHATDLGLEPQALRAKVAAWKSKLLEVRGKRVWPGLDDKVLTSWNALMIGALAQGGVHLKEKRYRDAAVKAADWLLANLRTTEGRWLATYNRGRAKLAAYLDDHAYLANAFVDLFEATQDKRWLTEAESVVAIMDEHFLDKEDGGYFFVADDHEKLLVRVKNPNDNATPSGNGMAAKALVRLATATGKREYANQAVEVFRAFHTPLISRGIVMESMLLALQLHFESEGQRIGLDRDEGPQPVVTRGPVTAELLVGHDKLRAGAKVPVAIRLAVKDGWHIQARNPARDGLTATRFRLLSNMCGTLADEKYPAPEKLAIDPKLGLGKEILVYGGEVLLGGYLVVPRDLNPGTRLLRFEVAFQACDDKSCQASQHVVVSRSVDFVSEDDGITQKHVKVFDSIGLK